MRKKTIMYKIRRKLNTPQNYLSWTLILIYNEKKHKKE